MTAQLQALASTLQLQLAELERELQQATQELENAQKKVRMQGHSSAGPCMAAIEQVLQRSHIQRQAYHGGAFTGNHVHKALQAHTTQSIVSAPCRVVTERISSLEQAGSPQIVQLSQAALAIEEKYSCLLSSYSSCHQIMTSTDTPTAATVQGPRP